jgi:hypothetical protein
MLATTYVLRRSENKGNSYSFFQFVENALVKVWILIYAEKDFSAITKFDELHDVYIDSLKKWIESLNEILLIYFFHYTLKLFFIRSLVFGFDFK